MEVKPISDKNPTFKGYIGKNLKTYVNEAVKHEVGRIVTQASSSGKPVESEEIQRLKAFGQNVLDKFSKYMAKTNKNSVLDFGEEYTFSSYTRLHINNTIDPKKTINIYPTCVHEKVITDTDNIAIPVPFDINPLKDAKESDLHQLDIYANNLKAINPKEIDKIFLESADYKFRSFSLGATGFFAKMKANRLAKKIDEFAKSLGIEATATSRLEMYLKKAKENKIKFQEQKQLEKTNQKIAKKILNS